MPQIDPDISWYYGKGRESERLAISSQLEAARTRRIISTRIANRPLSIVDIGGGPGVYALWLSQLGHSVHLLDPIELHLEQARRSANEAGIQLAGFHHAEAERLPFEDASFDVALFLGPLYHITERRRRIDALRETFRILRPGGKLFAAAICRYGTVIEGFFKGYVTNPQFANMMQRTIREGQHRNPAHQDGLFTTSYFHKPEQLREELSDPGFSNIELLTIEGAWSCIPDFERKWQDETFRSLLMDTIEFMEADPTTIGFGGHMMAVASRAPMQANLRRGQTRPAMP